MNDKTQIAQNEALLKEFLGQADKKFALQVGAVALVLLTEEMPPEQFQGFLKECVDNAVAVHRFKMMGGSAEPAEDNDLQNQDEENQAPQGEENGR